MIDDSISTSTSTSGGRYGETSSPRTEPGSPSLTWRSQIDRSTGNTHWLACGPDDDKMWRLSPILMNMETWWTNESDYPLKVIGQSWLHLEDAKRDIENRHRMIDMYKRAMDTANRSKDGLKDGLKGESKDGPVRDQNQTAASLPERLAWRDLPTCNGWWIRWDRATSRPYVSYIDINDSWCTKATDGRLWFGPIDDPYRAAK